MEELRPTPDGDERQPPFLDLNNDVSDRERGDQFREALDCWVTPVLSKTGTLRELKASPSVVGRSLVDKDAIRLGIRGGIGTADG